jgi:hypothetical protein
MFFILPLSIGETNPQRIRNSKSAPRRQRSLSGGGSCRAVLDRSSPWVLCVSKWLGHAREHVLACLILEASRHALRAALSGLLPVALGARR